MISHPARKLPLLTALCVAVLAVGCGGGQDSGPPAAAAADPAFSPVTGEVASRALSAMRSLYEARGAEIGSKEVGGQFRLAGDNQFVPADLSYLSARIQVLLDTTRPVPERLGQGAEAVTMLIAGFRTTEMSEFGIAAHDVLDYVRAVSETPGDASVPPDYQAARIAPLEQQLKALETSCTCR